MIAYIKGIVQETEEDALIIERDGIGFRVYVPSSMLDGSVRAGEETRVYTYMNVKEDAIQLFGFPDRDTLGVFRQLITVSGIGPKGALGILSVMDADSLRFAVLSDDVKYIMKAPGIGKKTAQKLILELKDRFRLEDAFEKKLEHNEKAADSPEASAKEGIRQAQSDAVEALVALGYSGTEALRAVRAVDAGDGMDTEAILKAALKKMF